MEYYLLKNNIYRRTDEYIYKEISKCSLTSLSFWVLVRLCVISNPGFCRNNIPWTFVLDTIWAGFPVIIEFSGKCPLNTLPAPIIQLSPIVVLERIIQLIPIKTLFPINILPNTPPFMSSKHQVAPSCVMNCVLAATAT